MDKPGPCNIKGRDEALGPFVGGKHGEPDSLVASRSLRAVRTLVQSILRKMQLTNACQLAESQCDANAWTHIGEAVHCLKEAYQAV